MSEEMAVGDTTCNEDAKVNGEEAVADAVKDESTSSQQPSDSPHPESTKSPQPEEDIKAEVKIELETMEDGVQEVAVTRGMKRRASSAFSEDGEFHGFVDGAVPEEEFKGFDSTDDNKLSIDYGRILERLEAEVSAAAASFTPLRNVQATALLRASKRPRTDTDGSRPSSALSSRSDGDGALSTEATSASTSPLPRRRATTEMSSPLLRLPLAAGWRRELVHRATFDSHNRRQADIYYYTPQGKKLRSTREVGEHLYGTGFTLENFSFFKEPLGIDDPEKEIIRDAKMQRTRVESPVPPPPAEGKRTPKPKPPKGASPEPATPKSPPPKIRVKSLGSRLSAGAAAKPTPKKPANDNNNTATWKKPRAPAAVPTAPVTTAVTTPVVTTPVVTAPVVTAPVMPSAPPPLQSRPHPLQQHVDKPSPSPMAPLQPRGVPQPPSLSPSAPPAPPAGHPPGTAYLQPCSLQCGRGVPTLACTACLCLYHPVCARADTAQDDFVCRNCRKSSSPPLEPPPLLHKSASGPPSVPRRNAPVPVPIPVPVPVPVPAKVRPDKRVLLRMKVSGGNPDGSRVWAVARPTPAAPATSTTPSRPPPTRPPHPQSLALLNGRRFIVVPRNAAGSGSHQ